MIDNIILFISGKASSGKDTFVNQLKLQMMLMNQNVMLSSQEQYNWMRFGRQEDVVNYLHGKNDPVVRISFADGVKRELCRLHPEIEYERLFTDPVYKEQFRKEMIEIGDGYRKNLSENIWVDKLSLALSEYTKQYKGKIIVVPDLRYKNELAYANALKIDGYLVMTIRMEASLPTRISRMSLDGMTQYINYGQFNDSECELDNIPDSFDIVCNNNGSNPLICGYYPACEIVNIFNTIERGA